MAKCEKELLAAQEQGLLKKEADAHVMSMDICSIVKGCVLEWALCSGEMQIETSLRRIVQSHFAEKTERTEAYDR